MQLSYRGVKYDYNPASSVKTEYAQPAVDLKYRGASYRRQQVAKVERLGVIFKYRGATYTHRPTVEAKPVPATVAAQPAEAAVVEKARLLNLSHSQAVRNRHHVVLARFASTEGFMSNLANYWNQVQGEIDPNLWADYDRSHVSLS